MVARAYFCPSIPFADFIALSAHESCTMALETISTWTKKNSQCLMSKVRWHCSME